MTWDHEVDCSGLRCPLPVLRARKTLAGMATGAVLRLRATDPAAVIDLPHFCAEAGHTVLDITSDGTDARIYLLRKG